MLADLQTLGERLKIASTGNVEKDARAALDHLGSVTEPWLLVYDNAPNPDAVRQWLPVGAVRCIITSRFSEFGGLAPVTRVDQWPDTVTADYLLARTGRDDTAGAARLAEKLDGLPLAAEQAAVFLSPRKGVRFDEYAKEIARLIKQPRPPGAKGEYPDTVYAAFVKSLEAVPEMPAGAVALDLLRLCAFLSPDGVDLWLLTVEWGNEVMPAPLATAMAEKFAREDALAALASLSLLRQEDGPEGPVLIFHRLLLEVARDWMGADARALWGSAAVRLVNRVFPWLVVTEPSTWARCARLMPHVAPLDAHAPAHGEAGRALRRLLKEAGRYLSERGDRAGALGLAERGVALIRTRRDEPLQLAAALNALGGRYADFDRLNEAEAAFREALEIGEPLRYPKDPSRAVTLSNRGRVHWKRREFDTAEPLFLRVAEVMKAAQGVESAEYGLSLSNLGVLYGDWADEPGQAARRAQEAEYCRQALIVTRKARGARHPETAVCYHNLAANGRARRETRSGRWRSCCRSTLRSIRTRKEERAISPLCGSSPANPIRRRGCAAATSPICCR